MSEASLNGSMRRHVSVPVVISLVLIAAGVGALAAMAVQQVEANSERVPKPVATQFDADAEFEPLVAQADPQNRSPKDWESAPVEDPFVQFFGSDPFQDMREMQERMRLMMNESVGRLHSDPLRNTLTVESRSISGGEMNLTEEEDAYILEVDMPGLEEGTTEVTLENNRLGVSGTTQIVETNTNGTARRTERREMRFARTIVLPGPVNPDELTTEFQDGVLKVRVPKNNSVRGTNSLGESHLM